MLFPENYLQQFILYMCLCMSVFMCLGIYHIYKYICICIKQGLLCMCIIFELTFLIWIVVNLWQSRSTSCLGCLSPILKHLRSRLCLWWSFMLKCTPGKRRWWPTCCVPGTLLKGSDDFPGSSHWPGPALAVVLIGKWTNGGEISFYVFLSVSLCHPVLSNK